MMWQDSANKSLKHRIAAAIRGQVSPIIQMKTTPRTSTVPSLQVSGGGRHQQQLKSCLAQPLVQWSAINERFGVQYPEFRCLEHRSTFDFEMDSLFKPLLDMFKHHDFRVKYKKTGDNILGFCTSLFLSILYICHLYTFLLYRAD